MDKQVWFDKERRSKTALAIINKLEKAEQEDLNLIPAINDYIETGNIKMFEGYCAFKRLADSIGQEKMIKRKTEDLQKATIYYEDIKKEFDAYIKKETEEREELRKKLDSMFDEHKAFTIGELYDFLKNEIENNPYRRNNALYFYDGTNIDRAKSIMINDKGKFVLSVRDKMKTETTSPENATNRVIIPF